MASKQDDTHFEPSNSHRDESQSTVLERVQELTWALLDEDISDDEMSLLDTLLLTGDEARNRYVECVQLHTDLMVHYGGLKTLKDTPASKSPVLTFLGTDSSAIGIPSPRIAE